jgi:type-F conjugative transfer system pilin assembly protein TrbC
VHSKYVILGFIALLFSQVGNSLAQETIVQMPNVDQFVKDIENNGDADSAAELLQKVQNLPINTQNVKDVGKSQIVLPLPKAADSAIANEKGVDIGQLLNAYQPQFNAAAEKPRKLNQLIIFISTSMPKESLIALGEQAKKADGLLVLRGLVNNSFKETASLLQGISPQGLDAIIDPRLFEAFAVESVPTFVVTPIDSHPCGDRACKFTPLHDKIAGNISLEYALEQIAKSGKAANAVAQEHLIKLRGKS